MRIDMQAEYGKLRAAIQRPLSAGAVAVNPADQPALTRYIAIQRHIRKGKTFEEALAYYDKPRGVCACGEKSRKPNGRLCESCYKGLQVRRVKSIRAGDRKEKKAREVVRTGRPCACGCGVPVYGPAQRTKECAAAYKAAEDRRRARERYLAKVGTVRERPYAQPRETPKPPERVITPDGVTVQRIAPAPLVARGLRNLFGDESGNCWSAAD